MGKIKKILENELVGGTQSTNVYPVTSVKAVYDKNNKRLDNIIKEIETDIDNLNANTGISEYPAFDPATDYAVGNVVMYEGILYRFIADHAAGEWIGTDAENWSERKEVNKIYLEFVKGNYIDSLGRFSTAANDSYGGTLKYYRVKSGTTYRTNCHPVSNFYLAFYDENKKFISAILTDKREDWAFTAPENAVYARFSHQSSLENWTAKYYESYDLLTQVREDIETNKDNIDELILDSHVGRVLNFLRQEKNGKADTKGDIIVNRTFSEGSVKSNIEWRAYDSTTDKLTYALASLGYDSTIRLNPNTVIVQTIKNTGNDTIDISVGIGLSRDWSSAIKYRRISIAIGETKNVVFTENDWKESSYYSENCAAYCTIALFGRDNLPRPSVGGSLEWMISYKEIYVQADKAKEADFAGNAENCNQANQANVANKSITSTSSINAGWALIAPAENAVVREVLPTGGMAGAIEVEVMADNVLSVKNTMGIDVVANKYRGIYWKISWEDIEDLNGTAIFRHNKSYNTTKILGGLVDWGNPTVHGTINLTNEELNNGVNIYEKLIGYKEAYPNSWENIYGKNKYLYVTLLDYLSTGKIAAFEDVITTEFLPKNSKVIATGLAQELKEELRVGGVKRVTCWGDSLTAGAGSSNHTNQEAVIEAIKSKGYPDLALTSQSNITYSIMMQELLGDKYNVTNCGVGGESLNTIAARLGANLVYAKNDFVLPADTTSVQIGAYNGKLDSSWGVAVAPLLQGAGNSVNPCYVQGVECTLKWTGNSSSDTEGTYTLQRVGAGDRAVSLPAKTPIILSGSKLYRDTKLAVLWCWQNGGYTSSAELIEKLDKMIAHLNTPNYVIVGLHSGTESSRQEQEDMLTSKYGDKFFNWRQYISTNALYDFGISPSKEDLTAMESGSAPPSLLTDSVHLCAAGYAILGFKIIERFKNLGYIS